ncbi:hypothetical protein [Massilia sp. HP4]|uniref:hypothetical protein n=1 Tax=Massilia sp. HP4 TaxID=2562316 RepID=UPI0010C041A7|nr:hypothetical protein [Massilia sp. HP4]
MLPAIVIEQPPRLVRAIRLLPGEATPEEAAILADELSAITAMVAGKFTNDRTAEGIGRALLLTVGGVSLGLEHLIQSVDEGDLDAVDILVGEGAEHAFQTGFRMIRELAALPEDSLVNEYDNDPVYAQRRLKELFVDICTADPGESWSGYERFLGQVQQRQQVQSIVKAAEWLRQNHYEGAVKDPDLNAEGVIAMAIIFAAEGGARITARTGQREFERFVKALRKHRPDFEQGWAELMARIPPAHQAVIAERIDIYRKHCTVLEQIGTPATIGQLMAELENYAGSELDPEYP